METETGTRDLIKAVAKVYFVTLSEVEMLAKSIGMAFDSATNDEICFILFFLKIQNFLSLL